MIDEKDEKDSFLQEIAATITIVIKVDFRIDEVFIVLVLKVKGINLQYQNYHRNLPKPSPGEHLTTIDYNWAE